MIDAGDDEVRLRELAEYFHGRAEEFRLSLEWCQLSYGAHQQAVRRKLPPIKKLLSLKLQPCFGKPGGIDSVQDDGDFFCRADAISLQPRRDCL